MATIAHRGIKLAYEDQGAGKQTFVFIHGWTCERSSFAPQAKYFAQRHRVISVDLRGHGQSDKPEGHYPITAYAEDIAYLIEQLGLDGVLAVGHSMGGAVVLQLAAKHPERLAGIVMIDPIRSLTQPNHGGRTATEKMLQEIEAGNQEPRRKFIADNFFLPGSDQDIIENILQVMMAAPSHVAVNAMRGIQAFDGATAAAQCRTPALHIAATTPQNPPHLMSQLLPNVINGMTVGAGHFCQLEVPDQVNAMIESFLRHYV
jgi:pimeloyl-ACP methyl ester carboxylesterase